AAVRPWERPGAEPGTPEVAATLDALGSRLHVQIDSLERQGTTVRLQWTVKNIGTENVPLHGKLGATAFDGTVSRVSIVPPGVGNPLYPAVKDEICQCASVPQSSFGKGAQLQLWAVFEGLPESADGVDVNLGPLGAIRNVAVKEAG
ncbi:hypothetical protein ACWEPC_53730, partial [Nonomuraea sp. NPDC004297]